jgi:hypothetical protein
MKRSCTVPDAKRFTRRNLAKLEDGDFIAMAAALNGRSHLAGRDVNVVNTVALTVVRRDGEVTPDSLRGMLARDKSEAREFLETHHHPNDNVVLRVFWSGRRYLDLLGDCRRVIDEQRRRIDAMYDTLEKQKLCLVKPLGLPDRKAPVPENASHPDPFVRKLIASFFALLNRIRELKEARLTMYARIDAVKDCWSGYLSNREVEIATTYDAAVIREDAT